MNNRQTDSRQEKQVASFAGFTPLTANFLYCPNQFFDVCLATQSRGALRIVAYLVRRTLGWLDEEGSPIEQEIAISYSQFVREAGVSRGAIGAALDEAIEAGFIVRTQLGAAKASGTPARTACYALRWDQAGDYTKDPQQFVGFFAGEGNRTPIPNSFFDQIVPTENLAVLKVVGTVLRHTIGYQNQFGGRRASAPLSYSFIQRYTNLVDRSTLHSALQRAVAAGYIVCTEKGTVGSRSAERRPATYRIKWLDDAPNSPIGSNPRPVSVQKPDQPIGSVSRPAKRFNNQTSDGSLFRPAGQFRNPTKEKKPEKETNQQHAVTTPSLAVAASDLETFEILRSAGFDKSVAAKLAPGRRPDEVNRQIAWLAKRNPRENPLGMLRRAIEEKWSEPTTGQNTKPTLSTGARPAQAAPNPDALRAADYAKKQAARRAKLLAAWKSTSISERKACFGRAILAETSAIKRNSITRRMDFENPPSGVLEFFAWTAGIDLSESGPVLSSIS